jgi:hypothetical protein
MGHCVRNMQRAGDIAVIKKALRITSPAAENFIEASEVIRQAPLDGEPAFSPKQLIQCTLPHSNPGDVTAWTRRNGNFTLGIVPGIDLDSGKSFGFPYGTMPRLVLFWITREVLRTNSRRVALTGKAMDGSASNTLSAFMRELGVIPASAGGGKRSDAKRLKEQMRRLFRASISFQWNGTNGGAVGEAWLDMKVAPKGELWWDPKRPEQDTLWGSWIELGEEFFKALLDSPVPVDMRALRALKGSALALDLYVWAVWRADYATRKGEKQFMAWSSLMRQMGCDYKGKDAVKDFKHNAKATLKKVRKVYPLLKISDVAGGLYVHPSPPAIPRRAARRNLSTAAFAVEEGSRPAN